MGTSPIMAQQMDLSPFLLRQWVEHVNRPQTNAEVNAIRVSVVRGQPLGSPTWVQKAAKALGLKSTLRPRGRPRKPADD